MFKNVGYYAILLILVAAIVMVVMIACRAMGVAIPAWVEQIAWVLVIAFVAIGAIKILTTNWSNLGPPTA